MQESPSRQLAVACLLTRPIYGRKWGEEENGRERAKGKGVKGRRARGKGGDGMQGERVGEKGRENEGKGRRGEGEGKER